MKPFIVSILASFAVWYVTDTTTALVAGVLILGQSAWPVLWPAARQFLGRRPH